MKRQTWVPQDIRFSGLNMPNIRGITGRGQELN